MEMERGGVLSHHWEGWLDSLSSRRLGSVSVSLRLRPAHPDPPWSHRRARLGCSPGQSWSESPRREAFH